MQVLNIVLFWIFFGFLTSYLGKKKGRHAGLWFVIGLFLGIIGVLIAFLLPKPKVKEKPIVKVEVIEPKVAEWYYLNAQNEQSGPHSDLKPFWRNKTIDENTLVWTEGMHSWKALKQLPNLFRDLSEI